MDLLEASKTGNLERVKELISQGVDNLDKALRKASTYGHLEIIKYLDSQGADIHACDDGALRLASYNGQLEVVKYLVEQGADIHAKDDNALRFASEKGHLEIIKYLEDVIRDQKLRKIRERIALRVITKASHNWIWKGECADGTIGIVPRLSMKLLNIN
jgi:ankyrin repeat protein